MGWEPVRDDDELQLLRQAYSATPMPRSPWPASGSHGATPRRLPVHDTRSTGASTSLRCSPGTAWKKSGQRSLHCGALSKSSVALLLAALLLEGCGASSGRESAATSAHERTVKQLTVPGYSVYPPTTIPITVGTPAMCRSDAAAFVRAAVSFVAPSSLGTRLEADQYYYMARLHFFGFKAHQCNVAILRNALARRLTVKQRRYLARRFGFLDGTARELT
jgi:hypothetical protein